MRPHLILSTALLFCSTGAIADHPLLSSEESLLVKRITEYWKDQDYEATKKQIVAYLTNHEEGGVSDHLRAMLGDVYFKEGSPEKAIATYEQIKSDVFREKTLANYMHALFALDNDAKVLAVGEEALKKGVVFPESAKLVFAETLFRTSKTLEGNEKTDTLLKAEPFFTELANGKYRSFCLYPLAEIAASTGHRETAASHYLELASNHPEKAESLLLQAANLQASTAPEEAAVTLGKVVALGGSNAPLASYNQLLLLSQTKQHQLLVAKENEFRELVEANLKPSVDYFVGKSLIALGDESQGCTYFERFIQTQTEPSAHLRIALIHLISHAEKNGDLAEMEKMTAALQKYFPTDVEIPNALFAHAHLCIDKGDFLTAQTDLQNILLNFPTLDKRESLIYDYALVLFQNENFSKSREVFLSLLDQFPETDKFANSLGYVLKCSMRESQNPHLSPEEKDACKKAFIADLELALSHENVIEVEERSRYELLLAKSLYEIGRYGEASGAFETYLKRNEGSADTHFMLAISYLEASGNLHGFVKHGEKALELDQNLKAKEALLIQLYNAYLSLAKETPSENSHAYLDLAAKHLYENYKLHSNNIKKENQSWLANYYFSMSKEEGSLAKATTIFEDLLLNPEDSEKLTITDQSLYLEGDAMRLAEIYLGAEKYRQRITLLESLKNTQDQNPSYGWKHRSETAFALGKAYEEMGRPEMACDAYKTVIAAAPDTSLSLLYTAELQRAKLQYALLPLSERKEGGSEMSEILGTFKDLQIKKRVQTEPLHLEAALEYANIRIALTDASSKNDRAIFFLGRILEDYEAKEDGISSDYLQALSQNSEKRAIYDAYMRFIHGEIKRHEALISKENGDLDKAEELENLAIVELTDLRSDTSFHSPLLSKRIEEKLKELGYMN